MSKINQIEDALKQIDQATFQKLMDAYLVKRGYKIIIPIGSVDGINKTKKGIPDSRFEGKESKDKYIFAQYTTQRARLIKKALDDINECLNKEKTGVSKEKIEEIILCSNLNIEPINIEQIKQKEEELTIRISIFSLSRISNDLLYKYPGLAKDFLGISIDAGQILEIDEFVKKYNNSHKASTSIDTHFYFREKELNELLGSMNSHNFIIVYGKAGIGKTRLCVELCKEFKKINKDYKVFCIYNLGINIYEDLTVYFSVPGKYLIFIDDINRVKDIEIVLDFLSNCGENREFKILCTVRDYSLNEIKDKIENYTKPFTYEVQKFSDKQIEELVKNEYAILNQFYLERISSISKGNPRIALMASKIAKESNRLESIVDVSGIYKVCFEPISKDLSENYDENLLKVFAIIHFLEYVDKTVTKTMNFVDDVFKISSDIFWKEVNILYELEMVNSYENEVVKASDQALADYISYMLFFEKKELDLSKIFEDYFPQYKYKLINLVESSNEINQSFVDDTMKEYADRYWDYFQNERSEEDLFHFLDIFWYIKPYETLSIIKDKIDKLVKSEINLNELDFKLDNNIDVGPILRILSSYLNSTSDDFSIALDLIFDYMEKRPDKISEILYVFTQNFSFKHTSSLYGFQQQKDILEKIWPKAENGSNFLFTRLFISIAGNYLGTQFQEVNYDGKNSVKVINFILPATKEIIEIRKFMIEKLVYLFDSKAFKQKVVKIIEDYIGAGWSDNCKKIIETDSSLFLPFFENNIPNNEFQFWRIAQDYMKLLNRFKISYSDKLKDKFQNESMKLAYSLIYNFRDFYQKSEDLDPFIKIKDTIRDYLNDSSNDDCNAKKLLDSLIIVYKEIGKDGKYRYNIQSVFYYILQVLSEVKNDRLSEFVDKYLKLRDPLKITPEPPIILIFNFLGKEKTLELLDRYDFQSKPAWLLSYYSILPEEYISIDDLQHIYSLYQNITPENLLQMQPTLDYLLKYRKLDEDVIIKVVKICAERVIKNIGSCLFLNISEINKQLFDIFKNEINLLEKLYFDLLDLDKQFDYDGFNFKRFIDVDSSFITKYIDWIYDNVKHPDHDDIINLSFLWLRENYMDFVIPVIDKIYDHEKSNYIPSIDLLESFFILTENEKNYDFIIERENNLLKLLITERNKDIQFISFLFKLIDLFVNERKIEFVKQFINLNNDFDSFSKLYLGYGIRGGFIDDIIKQYEKDRSFLKELIPLFNKKEFLEHKEYIQKRIECLEKQIKDEKKRRFIDS